MKPKIIIQLEGWISFLIPFLSAVGGSELLLDSTYGKIIAMICLALVGGLSGLKSFLSTTFSDSLPEETTATMTVYHPTAAGHVVKVAEQNITPESKPNP